MNLIDIGVNLAHKRFSSDLRAVLERAATAGVTRLIATGTSLGGSGRTLELAKQHPDCVWATAGIHPHNARDYDQAALEALREFALDPRVVAIGECGLDYDRDFSPRPIQRACFEAQLRLAAELDLPVFLHQREAHDDFCAILAGSGVETKAVVHCFTGNARELDGYLELGCSIGITGYVCDERRGRHLGELMPRIPDERLMVETDAPFLLPRDLAAAPPGKRNEPMYLPHVLRAVAGHRSADPDHLASVTARNATRFFGLPEAEAG